MHQKITFLLLFVLANILWQTTSVAQQTNEEKNKNSAAIAVIQADHFVVTPKTMELIQKYVTPQQYDSATLYIYPDSILTTTTLVAILDTMRIATDSITKIKSEIVIERDRQHRLSLLSQIEKMIVGVEKNIKRKKLKRRRLSLVEDRAELSVEINVLNNRLKELNNEYNIVLTGVDTSGFFIKEELSTSFEEEFGELFSPVIRDLKGITSFAQRFAKLTADMTYYKIQLTKIKHGIAQLEKIEADIEDKEQFLHLLEFWQEQETEFTTKLNMVEQQLHDEQERRKNGPANFMSFVKGQGKNILLALLTFIGILFLFYLLHQLLSKKTPFYRSPQYIIWANIIDLGLFSLAMLFGVSGFLYVLFLLNDWLSLGVAVILVLSLVWSGKDSLLSSGKLLSLLLNNGSVRQNERVIYEGVPYKVNKIGLFSYLVNPELSNGSIRLPLNDLLDLRSRACSENESWFPTHKGDQIVMEDGMFRTIIDQTPEQVLMTRNTGTPITMPTTDFLAKKMENLSRSPFRIWYYFTINNAAETTVYPEEMLPLVQTIVKEKINELNLGIDWSEPLVDYTLADNKIKTKAGIMVPQQLADQHILIIYHVKRAIFKLAMEQDWPIMDMQVVLNEQEVDLERILIK